MEPLAELFAGNTPIGMTFQWILLTICFVSLLYLFRETVEVEGLTGWLLVLFVLLPINVAASNWLKYIGWPDSMNNLHVAYSLMLVVINLVLFFAFTLLLPGLTVSNNLVLVLFIVVFTGLSVLVKFLPNMFVVGPVATT